MTLPISDGRFIALRLMPGENLVHGLRAAFEAGGTSAMAVVSCVGSLTRVRLRHANRDVSSLHEGHFEILSLVGTIDAAGQHIHLSMGDGDGRVSGGHLMEEDSSVYTTAEIVVVALPRLCFSRQPCLQSGYDELMIDPA